MATIGTFILGFFAGLCLIAFFVAIRNKMKINNIIEKASKSVNEEIENVVEMVTESITDVLEKIEDNTEVVEIPVKDVNSMTFGEVQKSIKDTQEEIANEVQLEMIEDEQGDGEYVFVNDLDEVEKEIEDELEIELINEDQKDKYVFVDLEQEELNEVQTEIETEIDNNQFEEQSEEIKEFSGCGCSNDNVDQYEEVRSDCED